MSKTRASKVRNEIHEKLGLDVSYKQIADKCRQLQIPFKDHPQMGIHYNSVLEESDSVRLVNAFRDQPKKSAKPAAPSHKPQRDTQARDSRSQSHAPRERAPQNQARQGQPRQGRSDAPSQGRRNDAPYRSQDSRNRSGAQQDRRPPRPGDSRDSRDSRNSRRDAGPRGDQPRRDAGPRGDQPRREPFRRDASGQGGPNRRGGSRPEYRSDRPSDRGRSSSAPGGGRSSAPASGQRESGERFEGNREKEVARQQREARFSRSPSGPSSPGRSGPGGPSSGRGPGGPGGRGPGGPGRGRGGQPPHQRFGSIRGRKGKKSKYRKDRNQNQQQQEKTVVLPPEERIIELHHNITVGELAEKLHTTPSEVIKALFMKGMMTNINHMLELETAEMVAQEMEFEVLMPSESKKEAEAPKVQQAPPPAIEEHPDNLKDRPPVVTIMGHVDHGKTSLLDYIRKAKVTEGEAGGITQHIGAYMVDLNGKPIAFLDTPGHEAFTAMRARGAQVTDIAILVIAADDGIMPQTVEAINHARAAKVQIIVAVNKIDKPGADLERAKQQLTEYDLIPEEWGGDTVIVPVSAKTGEGVDDLLEMIILVSDILELKANPDRPAQGVVIEAKLEKGRGSVGTVLIQNGTLKQGDSFVVGPVYGKVRAMTNERGTRLKKAGPSVPVEIIGFQDVPSAGDFFEVVKGDKEAKAIASKNREKIEEEDRSKTRMNLSNLYENMQEGKIKELNIVLKADVQGSVDAIKQSVERLSNDQVQVRVIHGATGEISQYDIMLASASDALVVGFNVKADNNANAIAQQEKVEIRYYDIIYKLIEDIQNAMEGLLEPEMIEVSIGIAEVRAVFKISKLGTIAGSYVQEGRVERNAKVRVLRNDEVIFTGKISSLKRFKDDVKEVGTGYECGVGVQGFNDLTEGDKLEFFLIQARHEVAKA